MAYYCQVTDVTRTSSGGFRVDYELREDSTNPHTVVETGSIGLSFDLRLLDATIPAAERRRFIIDQIELHFRSLIDMARAGDAVFAAIQSALLSRRYPAA